MLNWPSILSLVVLQNNVHFHLPPLLCKLNRFNSRPSQTVDNWDANSKVKLSKNSLKPQKNDNKGSNRCLSESARGPYRLFAAMTNELTGYIDKYLNNTFKFGSNIFISWLYLIRAIYRIKLYFERISFPLKFNILAYLTLYRIMQLAKYDRNTKRRKLENHRENWCPPVLRIFEQLKLSLQRKAILVPRKM